MLANRTLLSKWEHHVPPSYFPLYIIQSHSPLYYSTLNPLHWSCCSCSPSSNDDYAAVTSVWVASSGCLPLYYHFVSNVWFSLIIFVDEYLENYCVARAELQQLLVLVVHGKAAAATIAITNTLERRQKSDRERQNGWAPNWMLKVSTRR